MNMNCICNYLLTRLLQKTNPNAQDVSQLFKAWHFQQYGSEHVVAVQVEDNH